jgi:hypothetical protein
MGTRSRFVAAVVIGALGLSALAAGRAAAAIGPCPVFPADHILNTPVDTLPVDPLSNQYIGSIGANTSLHPDFGSGLYEGGPIGIPVIAVLNQPPVPIVFTAYGNESDPGPYPIPPNAPIEGGPASTGDRHVLTVELGNCVLYELYRAFGPSPPDNRWSAESGAKYDLRGYGLRPDSFTSADAAGLPIFPLLVRHDEASAGEIRHAIRFTAQFTRAAHVWPARHDAATTSNPLAPPMGQRFRLKAGVDITGFPPKVRAIFQAFKTYGLVLADNGSNWFISGIPDAGWDNDELNTAFGQLRGSDFEAVDVSSLLIDPNSAQARQPVPPVFTGGVYVATGRIDGNAGPEIITGPDAGGGPHVKVFQADGTSLGSGFLAYPVGFSGGVRVAACDFDGDGRDEIVTAPGPGGGPHVRVFKVNAAGTPVAELASFLAYPVEFTGGVFVACGNVEGTAGTTNIVTGAGAGGTSHTRVLRYSPGAPGGVVPVFELLAYGFFSGGVHVAAGDVDGSGRASVITGPGPGGGAHIRVLKAVGGSLTSLGEFFAYPAGFTGGAWVAAGNVTGGGAAEVITGAGAGGGPHVRVFDRTGVELAFPGFLAYPLGFTGGVRVAGGLGQIVTAAGPGGGPHVLSFTAGGVPSSGGFLAY